ncbi:MAG: FAD-dependent oxidoreductase [Dehalobacterium sp.]
MADASFDVIIVGAGPAGLSAAMQTAGAGLSTLVIERGEYPGSKNVMGGVIYTNATNQIFPNFWESAPVERPVIEQRYWFLDEQSHFGLTYRSEDFGTAPYNAFTVFRAKFDRWMGEKAEAAGAVMITETVVKELTKEADRFTGVIVGRDQGQIKANVIILAEGVNCLLAQQAELQKHLPQEHLASAVKEVLTLPREKIEDRFNIEKGQGVTIEMFGKSTGGMLGTAFIYTNKDSLSLGVGALVSSLMDRHINQNDLLEALKQHPSVKPLIEGSEPKEYMAHLIPEGGYKGMPRIVDHGVMVVGDAAMLVNGIHREGSNLAMISGKIAGETAVHAHEIGNFSKETLALYQDQLKKTFVIKDLMKYQNTSGFLESNRHFLEYYPKALNMAAHQFFTVDGIPKKEKQRMILRSLTEERTLRQVGVDMFKLWRVLG